MSGVELIRKERRRQVTEEKWSRSHDDTHEDEELAMAAACYAAPVAIFVHLEAESSFFSGNTGDRGDRRLRPAGYYDPWPFGDEWDKRGQGGRIRELVKAGALIAAEIDRLQRMDTL